MRHPHSRLDSATSPGASGTCVRAFGLWPDCTSFPGLVVPTRSWLPQGGLPDRKTWGGGSRVMASPPWHAGGMQSVYEAAGGREGLLRLAGAWHFPGWPMR